MGRSLPTGPRLGLRSLASRIAAVKESSQAPLGVAAAREGIAGVLARWWIVAIVAIAGGLIGFVKSAPDSHHRVGMIATVTPLSGNSAVVQLGVTTPPGPSTSQFFGDQIVDDLASRIHVSPATARDRLDASQLPQPTGTVQIQLDATGASTAEATSTLRAWFAAIQAHRRQRIQTYLDTAERGLLRGRARAIAVGDHARANQSTVLLARLEALRGSYGADVRALRWENVDASVPSTRRSSTAKGLLAGLVAGVLIALAVALLDGRLRTPAALEYAFGIPTLADLRRRRKGRDEVLSLDDRLNMLAGREVTSVLIARLGNPPAEELAAEALRAGLNRDVSVTLGPPPGDREWLSALRGTDFWVVAASPGKSRSHAAAQVNEMTRRSGLPSGALVYV